MTDLRLAALAIAILVPAFAALPTAHADVLLRERVRIEATQNLPGRGMSMDEVESRYGAPAARLAASIAALCEALGRPGEKFPAKKATLASLARIQAALAALAARQGRAWFEVDL